MASELDELNEIAASVGQHRNRRAGHVRGWHRELGAPRFDSLIVALDIVGEKHRRGLTLFKHRLLICLGGWVVIQRQLQLSTVRLLQGGHGQPAKWALTEISLPGKAKYFCVEVQGLLLIVHVYGSQFDFHIVPPFMVAVWTALLST